MKLIDFIDLGSIILVILSICLGIYWKIEIQTWLILGVINASTTLLLIARRIMRKAQ